MNNVKKALTNGVVQISIVLGGVAITLINLYLTSLLTPVVQDIKSVVQRVDAVEKQQDNAVSQDEFMVYIKQIDRIEGKVDLILLNK